MNILVVLRKSECRLNALIVGGRIALATHSDITVLFVLPKVPERFDEYFEADTDKRGQSIKDRVETSHQIDQRLLEEAQQMLAGINIHAEVMLKQGDPVKEAIKESVRGGYDLMVVGSRALHGIKAKFESFSERLIEHASIPVLVASCVSDVSTILLCVEGTEQSRITAEYARDFAKAVNAQVTVLSVAKTEKEREKAQKAVEHAQAILNKAGIETKVKIRVGDPKTEIEKESVNYGLVLVGSHKFGILETLLLSNPSLDIVEKSKAPTLVVKDEE
ncbi:MAG: universal stress protein [Theionarchaea archaeon]|nr:universal stress protein [Theionarchaea archaeon]